MKRLSESNNNKYNLFNKFTIKYQDLLGKFVISLQINRTVQYYLYALCAIIPR